MSFKITPTDETFEIHDWDTSSKHSSRFRESTHLIPSPPSQGSKHKVFEPLIMKLPVVIGTPLLMLGLGIGLEVAIFFSNKNNGFKVPHSNIFDVFGDVSAQFLASFFPTLLIMPFAFAWRELDWNLRWFQPYVVLHKGNAVAEESVLLDYISLGPLLSLFRAMQYKHRVIFWSSFTAILTYLFQPLAGSVFQIGQAPQLDTTTVIGTRSVGLAPDTSDLNGFMAAAGYVDASVLHGLGDPPFVQRGWATAEIIFPKNPYLNGTLTVKTLGVQSTVNCSNPSEKPVLSPAGASSLLLSSKSIDGCVHNLTFDPSVATLQYGVDPVPCPGNAASLNVQFQPVMFWYYHIRDYDGSQEVKTVFCTPRLAVAEVQAVANLNDGRLISVKKIGDATQANNITSGTQAGKVFNGLVFDDVTNPFIQARSVATRSIVPAAVFKAANLLPNGSQSAFDLPNGILDLTSTLYTRHLSVSAKAIYFVDQNTTLPADVVSLVTRLEVDGLPGHLLALILVVTGFIGIFLHIIHRRARKRLLLAAPPGSIASVVALTSRSGFGELLLPYDDELTLEKKLEGLRFRLDRRTGAILAEETVVDGSEMAPDEAMLALLGKERAEMVDVRHSAVESSSLLAFRTAAGSLPWERSWAPAGVAPLQQHSNTEYVP